MDLNHSNIGRKNKIDRSEQQIRLTRSSIILILKDSLVGRHAINIERDEGKDYTKSL